MTGHKTHYAEVEITIDATLRLEADPEGETEPSSTDWANEAKGAIRAGALLAYADLGSLSVNIDETWAEG